MELLNGFKTIYKKDGKFYASKTDLTANGTEITFTAFDLTEDDIVDIASADIKLVFEQDGMLCASTIANNTVDHVLTISAEADGEMVFASIPLSGGAIGGLDEDLEEVEPGEELNLLDENKENNEELPNEPIVDENN